MKKIIIFLIILYILLISSNVHGMGFGGLKGEITFEPGKSQEFAWILIPTNDGMDYSINVGGDLAEYITLLTPDYLENISLRETPLVEVRLDLPLKEPSPGMHRIGIMMKEVDPNSKGGLSALSGAMPSILINVLYEGKYLVSEMDIGDINENGNIVPLISMNNYGKEQINKIQITHQIIDKQKEVVKTFNSKSILLKSDEGIELEDGYSSGGLEGGQYTLKSIINWDNEQTIHEKDFMIGKMDVDLISYDKNLTIGRINEFKIKVKSQWNGVIKGVSANIKIDNQEVKTASRDLNAWEEKELSVFIDTENMTEGIKELNITINYGELSKEENIMIELVELKKHFELSNTMLIVGGFSILIILLVGFNIYLLTKKEKSNRK